MPDKRKVLLLVDTARKYGRGLLRGIAEYCRLQGSWHVHIEQPTSLQRLTQSLKRWQLDGAIVDIPFADHLERLQDLGVPMITAMATDMSYPGLSLIDGDNLAMGQVGADHLVERGFRNFGFCGFSDHFWSQQRGQGFARRLKELGYAADIYQQSRQTTLRSWEKEQAHVVRWLNALPKPAGVLACNDDRARHVIEACKLADLHVPDEVAVLGIDNDEVFCDLFSPPLSSIELNTQRAGYEAAELLDRKMAGDVRGGQKIVVRPLYVVSRQSTDALKIEDEEVAKAVRYIREHAKEMVLVSDVVKEVALSRRALQMRFRRATGRTIYEEIRHAHVNQMALMLVNTNLPVLQIARNLGYHSVYNISRYFRQKTGMTPLAYRKQFGRP